MASMFKLKELQTTVGREAAAGVTTFMTMAYIIFVNTAILSGAGMPAQAVAAATCLGAAVASIAMGLWTNYPIALASGMGLNAALVAYATQPGMNWQKMMGVIVVEGVLITLLVLCGAREQVMNAIPLSLKRAISAGIGLLITFLGLQQLGWVVKGPGGAMLAHGQLGSKPVLVATAGLLLTILLMARKVRGAILLGIVGTALLAIFSDLVAAGSKPLFILPKAMVARPDFSTFGQADILGALNPALIGVVFAFLITDFFDTMGTLIGVGEQAGFLDSQGNLPRLKKVLLIDSLAAAWGGICGASSVTTYIESAAGVSQGGRSGLVAVVVGALFLAALFFSPIVAAFPVMATAPALVVVGYLMTRPLAAIDFDDLAESLPCFLLFLLIPLTQSISFGIGTGIIAHVLVKAFTGQARQVSPWLYGIALLFAVDFVLTKT